jgi:hypothetical protein
MLHGMIGRFTALAESLGMAVTGGSDYHGSRKDIALGEQGLTLQAFERLLEVREALAERK